MILKDTLRSIVKSQRADLANLELGVKRNVLKDIDLKVPFAIVLSGIRRCGKSTLLHQLIKQVKGFYYFNFEDPRAVSFEVSDFQKLEKIFIEEYGPQDYYFFDEIQNVQKWELFVRALLDKKRHVVITGSNASLLSRELGTHLTGRHLRVELFPFSFKEFCRLYSKKPGIFMFEKYFTRGGFPEYVKLKKAEILQELLNDILVRDISMRRGISNIKLLKEMAVYLLTNVGKEFSYNRLKSAFELGSVNSVISYISSFEDSYLLFVVPRFDYSLRKQMISPKKIYSIDNGMSSVNSASFSEDKGRMLENMVFLQLRQRYKNIFYFRERGECDFVIKEGTKITKAVQVCYELTEDNKKREIGGLIEAMDKFGLKEGLILTYNTSDEFENGRIKVLPVWKWMLKTK